MRRAAITLLAAAVGSMRYFTRGESEMQSSVREMLKKFPPE